jgi:hypothetical protein
MQEKRKLTEIDKFIKEMDKRHKEWEEWFKNPIIGVYKKSKK